ncbi:MAG: radical SAM protein [Polyangiaceae bacterium]|nr:radical SAM protein [Polyangiaceae bacterium]
MALSSEKMPALRTLKTEPAPAASSVHLPENAPAPPERWAENSLLVAFSFRCNLACTFCMVEDVLHAFEGTTLETFRRFAAQPGALDGIRRIVFSGGEVTLAKNLLEYIEFARSLSGIEHVRLQTNAVRLADKAYLKSLADAGCDEYFVSFHGHNAQVFDLITQKKGSFEEVLSGIEAVRQAGLTLITNTAIAAQNVNHLAEIVKTVSPFAPASMEFWNYWPRADEKAERGHFVRVGDARQPLIEALLACVERGIAPTVKWFPKCLLGPLAMYHDDGQPKSLIELSARLPDAKKAFLEGDPIPDYFEREPGYACIYEGVCEHADNLSEKGTPASGRCAGLAEPYISRFGWEANTLQPKRKVAVADYDSTMSLVRDAGEKRSSAGKVAVWLDRFGFSQGARVEGFTLVSVTPTQDKSLLSLAFQSVGGNVVVRIAPKNESRRAPVRTPSFDLFYNVGDRTPKEAASALIRTVALAIQSNDPGQLTLP